MTLTHYYIMFFMIFVPTAVTAIETMKCRKRLEALEKRCEKAA